MEFYVGLSIGKERKPKLVYVRWTRQSHREVTRMWVEREQMCHYLKLVHRGVEDGGMEMELESVSMRMLRDTGTLKKWSFRGGQEGEEVSSCWAL